MPTDLATRLSLTLALLTLLPLLASAQPVTLFENATVITGDGRQLVDTDLLVRGDTLIDVGDSTSISLPPEHYRPLLDEAGRHGIDVLVHKQYPTDMSPLLDAGASGFLHGRLEPRLGPDIAAATARAGAFLVPNLGMSPMQALVAATGAAAAELNQSDLGVLEPGRRASFVVLTADPLVDIRHTRRIEAVYLNGREIDRDAIARSLRMAL